MRYSILLVVILSMPVLSLSDTIVVPDDYPTIQGAIDASMNGDVILVEPGTYMENIDFLGKLIIVKSSGGAAVTVIDGGGMGSVVTFDEGEGADTILDGFTITNGFALYGAGIHSNGSSPMITNNIIVDNTATYHGGGIGCRFSLGVSIHHNTIHANEAHRYGGGIYIDPFSEVVVTDNIVTENMAALTTPKGGGMYCDGIITVRRNYIADNKALAPSVYTSRGGGMYCDTGAGSSISDNLVLRNEASEGGGVFCRAYPVLSNMTIVSNIAYDKEKGAGIHVKPGSHATVYNSILWNEPGDEICLSSDPPWNMYAKLTISHSDVQNGLTSVHIDPNCTLNWGANMIEDDPLFEDVLNNDYHLTWGSACINRGIVNAYTTPDDYDSDPRPFMGDVDMGFDEYSGEHRLATDVFTIPESGGMVNFTVTAGQENGGRKYFILGSITGTVPGFSLPGGQSMIRMNWDPFTDFMWNMLNTTVFHDFYTNLDLTGQNVGRLNCPSLPPGYVGLEMYYASCLGWPWEFVSNPVTIEVVP